ncbi:MAG: hypothetical protein HZA36_02050 [Parcubacteria group bacterium]|nr:hypothetical protein [Parcubacteria group bacterium]
MKQYTYFVVYGANEQRKDAIILSIGDGYHGVQSVLNNTVVSVERPILTEEDVRKVEKDIATKLADGCRHWVTVKIISFQLLGKFET